MAPSDPVAFLFSLERLGMKFGLENMRALCGALGHPERRFTPVLIAGTNGKGSVTAMVAAALRAAGHRTARYTSPHLSRLEERFVIDGAEVTPARLRASAGRVRDAVSSLLSSSALDAPPTFFECTTAVAFDLFRDAAVELAVLEVGLGGRLDATNVVTPVVSVITSIAMDHEAQLGHTLAAIAREKAGVSRPGVPLVCGRLPEEARAAIAEVAAATGAPVVDAAAAAALRVHAEADPVLVHVRTDRRELLDVRLGLRGHHQVDNASVAVATLDLLDARGWPVPDESLRQGLEAPGWPGRLEVFHRRGCEILVDAAHNPAGAGALAAYLRSRGWTGVTLLCGVMADKDVAGILGPLLPICSRLVCATPPTPRAMPAADLARAARGLAPAITRVDVIPDPAEALRAACESPPVVAAGSIFLVGPLRDILG